MFDIEKFGTKEVESDESKIFEYADTKDNVEDMNRIYDGAKDSIKESLINSLDLNETEKEVLGNIDFSSVEAVKNSSGMAKVCGDCPSTTCTYTETYYSCPSTEP